MKTVISGRLGSKPEVKTVQGRDGSDYRVVNFMIYGHDPSAPKRHVKGQENDLPADVPFVCRAWNSIADDLATMDKGERITLVADIKYGQTKAGDKLISIPTFLVKAIDRENTLQHELDELLGAYEDGRIEKIYDGEKEPEFEPDRSPERAFNLDQEQQKDSAPLEHEEPDLT